VVEIRHVLPDDVLKGIQAKLDAPVDPITLSREAWSVLNWVIDERAKGRLICSADAMGQNLHRLSRPLLDRVPKNRKRPIKKIMSMLGAGPDRYRRST
jgi:hypothetical protein